MTNENLIDSLVVEVKEDRERTNVDFMSEDVITSVRNFHKSFAEYAVTPLHNLQKLSKAIGIKSLYVKDEAHRFGLNAFKVLGGSYAVGKYLADRLGKNIEDVSFDYLKSKEAKDKIGQITFVTATDGNHGRGIAWAANQLGQKSVVYMPKGSSQIRLDNIISEGADAEIIDGDYDDAVAYADKMAQENNWVVIQDTAWQGYEDIPMWIMQGYGTIMDEIVEQLLEKGYQKPTHLFLQAGVGSFAASMLGYIISRYNDERPITTIVEPDNVDPLYQSAKKGFMTSVDQGPTIMAGLACGTPNTISWDLIKDYANAYLSCPDFVAARGMRILAAPLEGDPQIVSGESGAVAVGVVSLLMERTQYIDLKSKLKLDENSVVLVISTEGDTDPQKYKDIVWDGDCNSL